jgi:hypothetical protein
MLPSPRCQSACKFWTPTPGLGGNIAGRMTLKADHQEIEAPDRRGFSVISLQPCAKIVGEASQFTVVRGEARELLSVFKGGTYVAGIAVKRDES